MERGVRLAVDVGEVRVGVAASDPDGILATPVETVSAVETVTGVGAPTSDAVSRVAEIIAEREPTVVYIGLPRTLKGKEGPAAQAAREFAQSLANRVSTPIQLVDERLTTVVAHQALHQSGRKMKSHRAVVDQQAAVEILQQSLDVERSTGRVPGIAVIGHQDDDETEAVGR
ncbi:MAG TPA: Holliday junction resolvase RuvX [Actinomycetales bacterium]|nr:Holliday junction resolvase RuvX [Actinomycetales bacterium]